MKTEQFAEIQDFVDGLYESIHQDHIDEWRVNPCTVWLLKTLEAEMALMFIGWYNNQFTGKEGALSPEQAQGKSQAIDDISEKIEEMIRVRERDD